MVQSGTVGPDKVDQKLSLFRADARARFVRRPNRFLIIAKLEEILHNAAAGEHAATGLQPAGEHAAGPAWSPRIRGPQAGDEVACHCPNPGRLLEFVIPGTELLLERRRGWFSGDSPASSVEKAGEPAGDICVQVDNADDPERGGQANGSQGSGRAGPKTQWTAVAVRYEGRMVPLFSARANGVVEQGVLPILFPQARNIQAEYTLADSRFDFMVQDGDGTTHLIEVKACSLVEEGIAMFPDAPSERAVKHIEELAELVSRGYRCHILFVIVHGNPERFITNLHTDPAFAAALSKAAAHIQVHAVTLEADERGEGHIINMNVPVDLSYGGLAEENRGSYLVVLELSDSVQVDVGSLGPVAFKAGWYVYSGSAQKNLAQRIGRHLRHVRKQPHWHLDYLTPHAGKIVGLPIASYENLECELAAELEKIGGSGVPRFGSTDCSCDSHLFYFSTPPLKNRDFLKVLFAFRHRRALKLPGGR